MTETEANEPTEGEHLTLGLPVRVDGPTAALARSVSALGLGDG